MKNRLTIIWLLLSSFGIMFAILSWLQESNLIDDMFFIGPRKGFAALILGLILYKYIAKKMG